MNNWKFCLRHRCVCTGYPYTVIGPAKPSRSTLTTQKRNRSKASTKKRLNILYPHTTCTSTKDNWKRGRRRRRTRQAGKEKRGEEQVVPLPINRDHALIFSVLYCSSCMCYILLQWKPKPACDETSSPLPLPDQHHHYHCSTLLAFMGFTWLVGYFWFDPGHACMLRVQ
jgi:hypothetical protein